MVFFDWEKQLELNNKGYHFSECTDTQYSVRTGGFLNKDFSCKGAAQQRGSTLASNPAPPCLILAAPKNLSLDVAEIYLRHYSEEWTEA